MRRLAYHIAEVRSGEVREIVVDKQIDCIRCQPRMELGWIVDSTHADAQQHWRPGEPERSFWAGLKLQKGQLVTVTTCRCPSCGYLESYAGA